ncbi:hypothetical protein ACFU98_30050 [Streptomyces sp. NPDC057575]
MPVPLYRAKAEFFRMLGHPVTPEAIAGARAHLHRAGVLPAAPETSGAVR